MIATRDIAVWAGSASSTGTAEEQFWDLVQLCDRVARPFENGDVFRVQSVIIDDWIDAGVPAREPHGDATVERVGFETVEGMCRRYFSEKNFSQSLSAELVTLEGVTTIQEPDGSITTVTGAISIQGMLTGRTTVWIRTRSDAWLPRGLLGDEQPQRHALNAPRLRRALEQANDVLGGILAPEPSKLAVVNGFDISNLPVPAILALLQ